MKLRSKIVNIFYVSVLSAMMWKMLDVQRLSDMKHVQLSIWKVGIE